MRQRRRLARGFAAVALLLLVTGCDAPSAFDVGSTGERVSQIDTVQLDASVAADGDTHVSERVTFAGDDGGTIALGGSTLGAGLQNVPITLPPGITLPTGFTLPPGIELPNVEIPQIPGSPSSPGPGEVTNVTVDGEPAQPTPDVFGELQLRVPKREAVVAYDVAGAVERFPDVAVLDLPVLPSPDDASRQDPDVALSGTVSFTGPLPAELVDPHLFGGRDRRVVVEDGVLRFSSRAPIWAPGNALYVAFPSGLVPEATQFDNLFGTQFQENARVREETNAATERVLDSVDDTNDVAKLIITIVAIAIPALFFVRMGIHFVAVKISQRREVGDVPDELREPPTNDDPAVVGALWAEGRPQEQAVAGTMLALAHRKAISIEEYGDRIVVKVPLMETGANETEAIVLSGLRGNATPEGVIEGPPVWRSFPQFRAYRRSAIATAAKAGYVTRVLRVTDLTGALATAGIGLGLYFGVNTLLYMPIVILASMAGTVLAFVSGYGLTKKGRRARALWKAFGEFLENNAEFRDLGPQAVTIWGPYLVYGAVVDEARSAAKPLTP